MTKIESKIAREWIIANNLLELIFNPISVKLLIWAYFEVPCSIDGLILRFEILIFRWFFKFLTFLFEVTESVVAWEKEAINFWNRIALDLILILKP